jgi:hypothetical protein
MTPLGNRLTSVKLGLQFSNFPVDRGVVVQSGAAVPITSASFVHGEPCYGCNASGLLAVLIWVG